MDKREKFIREYPSLQQTAQNYLGSLYDPLDYPSVEEVATKFDFRLVFSPVPDAGDFRIDLPNSELDGIRQQYEANANERVEAAMGEQWGKLHDMIARMAEKPS
jgi:hypothetical protein